MKPPHHLGCGPPLQKCAEPRRVRLWLERSISLSHRLRRGEDNRQGILSRGNSRFLADRSTARFMPPSSSPVRSAWLVPQQTRLAPRVPLLRICAARLSHLLDEDPVVVVHALPQLPPRGFAQWLPVRVDRANRPLLAVPSVCPAFRTGRGGDFAVEDPHRTGVGAG